MRAARKPIYGAASIAKFYANVKRTGQFPLDLVPMSVTVNGAPGVRLVSRTHGPYAFRLIVWRLAPRAMALLGGRLPSFMPFAAGLLETRDARNGRPHRRAVVYFHDGRDVVLVPSKGGMATDPHWLGNAAASPEVTFAGQRFRAEVVADEGEWTRLVELGDTCYPPYAAYRAHAARHGRRISVLRLVPSDRIA